MLTHEHFRDALETLLTVFPGATLRTFKFNLEREEIMAFFDDIDSDELQDNFELLSAGKYHARVTDHEWKENRSGHMLALTLEITGPTNAGRKLWDNLNLDNPSKDARRIALQSLKALCKAADADAFFDAVFQASSLDELGRILEEQLPGELYNSEIGIRVGVEEDSAGKYDPKNSVKAYLDAQSVKPAPADKLPFD